MFSAVHTDRSGRVFVSADYGAAAFDGASVVPLEVAIPLPETARLVPMPRLADGFDRAGHRRQLGRERLTLAAVLPPGFVRLAHPAFRDVGAQEILPALPYAAVGADAAGGLVVAALAQPSGDQATETGDLESALHDALRRWPSNRLVRQLARCARDFSCAAARNALRRSSTAPLPLGGPAAPATDAPVLPRWRFDEAPTERAAFQPTADEIAEVAVAHLSAGGTAVTFGRACDADPLGAVRLIEDSVVRIRAKTAAGRVHMETAGGAPSALRRLAAAGLDAVSVRLVSASPTVHELLAPGVRWPDVRGTLHAAIEGGVQLEIVLLVFPGISDRPSELASLRDLLTEVPGARIALRDLAADPLRTLARVPSRERPLGLSAMLDDLRRDVSLAAAFA